MPRSFDLQADTFDLRAGLPDDAVRSIVKAIEKLTEGLPDGKLLEIGAGTGQLGVVLNQLRFPYIGFDNSVGMLRMFKTRNKGGPKLKLVHTDGNKRWPANDSSVRVIFSSRALHLFELRHVIEQVFRVACPNGALLLTGSIVRPKCSARTKIRTKMRRLLGDAGIKGRSGKRYYKDLRDACCAQDGELLESRVVARWSVAYSPQQSLDSWAGKEGLAGRDISHEIKMNVLRGLEDWMREEFGGDLDKVIVTEETYVLESTRLKKSKL